MCLKHSVHSPSSPRRERAGTSPVGKKPKSEERRNPRRAIFNNAAPSRVTERQAPDGRGEGTGAGSRKKKRLEGFVPEKRVAGKEEERRRRARCVEGRSVWSPARQKAAARVRLHAWRVHLSPTGVAVFIPIAPAQIVFLVKYGRGQGKGRQFVDFV